MTSIDLKWYENIIQISQIADYGLTKGSFILKPYGWAIWQNIIKRWNYYLKKTNTQQVIMPTLFPYSYLAQEKEHFSGFAPETYQIKHQNNQLLSDPLVLRPTSEILFCHYFRKNIHSYHDLPLVLNQWGSVFRYEKNNCIFLRNNEFLWQEQHGAFADLSAAEAFSQKMHGFYQRFLSCDLKLAVLGGIKSAKEQFRGALKTYTNEVLLPNGVALQTATAHVLKPTFALHFQIKYQNSNNKFAYISQTSAGLSSRVLGALLFTHADKYGLILPWIIAPYQLALVFAPECFQTPFWLYCQKILKNYRLIQQKSSHNLGAFLQQNEKQGVCFQLILGQKEIANNTFGWYNRANRQKNFFNQAIFTPLWLKQQIKTYHTILANKARWLQNNTVVMADDFSCFQQQIKQSKGVLAYWSGSGDDEAKIQATTGASLRCLLNTRLDDQKRCFYTQKKGAALAYFARSY